MATGKDISLDTGYLFHIGDEHGLVMSLEIQRAEDDPLDMFKIVARVRPGIGYRELTRKVQDALFERDIKIIHKETDNA